MHVFYGRKCLYVTKLVIYIWQHVASVGIFFQIDKNNSSTFFITFYFIWEFQVLGTYERSAVTSAQTGRRGFSRIKADISMLNRNVNKWVCTHEEGHLLCMQFTVKFLVFYAVCYSKTLKLSWVTSSCPGNLYNRIFKSTRLLHKFRSKIFPQIHKMEETPFCTCIQE